MSSAEVQTYSVLLAAAPVTAIVGSGSAARIYSDIIPQEIVLPDNASIMYQRTETEKFGTLDESTSCKRVVIDISCLANTREGAEALGDAVEAAMEAAHHHCTGRLGGYEPETKTYGAVLSFNVWEGV